MAEPLRLLFWDVECTPHDARIWQLKTDYVSPGMVESEKFLLSWAAKWSDRKQVMSDVLNSSESLAQDDTRIVESLADLIREADIVVAHNGDKFDLPMLNARLLQLGLEPVGSVQTIDTLTLVRKSFKLASSSLDYVARVLGLDGKLHTSYELWRACIRGDEKALAKMVRYNRQDVRLLEQVFERIKPYVKGLPRMVDPDRIGEFACPHCGSTDLQKRGWYRTNVSNFRRYLCNNCGRWPRERRSEKAKLALTTTPR